MGLLRRAGGGVTVTIGTVGGSHLSYYCSCVPSSTATLTSPSFIHVMRCYIVKAMECFLGDMKQFEDYKFELNCMLRGGVLELYPSVASVALPKPFILNINING